MLQKVGEIDDFTNVFTGHYSHHQDLSLAFDKQVVEKILIETNQYPKDSYLPDPDATPKPKPAEPDTNRLGRGRASETHQSLAARRRNRLRGDPTIVDPTVGVDDDSEEGAGEQQALETYCVNLNKKACLISSINFLLSNTVYLNSLKQLLEPIPGYWALIQGEKI